MGKISQGQTARFTPKQKIIFDEIKNSDFINQNFYFTGGTALSSVYLQHRLSEDPDFFSQEKFDTLPILNLMTQWGKKYRFKVTEQETEVVKIFILEFPDKEKLKVEGLENLPKMLVPLKLKKLQNFFREKAKKIGMRIVKK